MVFKCVFFSPSLQMVGLLSIAHALPRHMTKVATEAASPANVTYKVGVILISGHGAPYDIERTGAAILLAFEAVNENLHRLFNGSVQLEPVIRSFGPACSAAKAPGECTWIF